MPYFFEKFKMTSPTAIIKWYILSYTIGWNPIWRIINICCVIWVFSFRKMSTHCKMIVNTQAWSSLILVLLRIIKYLFSFRDIYRKTIKFGILFFQPILCQVVNRRNKVSKLIMFFELVTSQIHFAIFLSNISFVFWAMKFQEKMCLRFTDL